MEIKCNVAASAAESLQQGDCRQLPTAQLCGSGQGDDYMLSSWSLYSPVRALPCLSCRVQAQPGMELLCPVLGHLQSHATCPGPAWSSLWHGADVLREIWLGCTHLDSNTARLSPGPETFAVSCGTKAVVKTSSAQVCCQTPSDSNKARISAWQAIQ